MTDEDSLAKKVAGFFLRLGWWGARKTGKAGWWGTKKTTKFTYDNREQIGKGVAATASAGAGLIKGTVEFAYNVGSLAYFKKEELLKLEEKIQEQSLRYNEVVDQKAHLIDMGIIGGVVLTDSVLHGSDIPVEVENAYEAAYPRMADEIDFNEAVSGFSSDELRGFLSGVKGKLFELKYAEHLNDGHLPEGYSAVLASSANQPGWDIAIHDADGNLDEVLQCKASDSVSYIAEAVSRYPDVDIVTLDDVHSQLMMHSALESVDLVNSGISADELSAVLDQAVEPGYGVSDLLDVKIPIASLALIAFSEYLKDDKSYCQKSFSFGNRGSKSFIAMTAGGAAAGLTGVWWVGLAGALGMRYIADKGKQMRKGYYDLETIFEKNEKMIQRVDCLG